MQLNVTCQLEAIVIFHTQAIRKSLASTLLLCCTRIRRRIKLGKFSYLPIDSIPRIETVPPQDNNNNNNNNNNNHLSQVSFYQATSVSINTTTVNV